MDYTVCDLIEQEKKLSIIECPICMETYDIPLFCPCGHTLCSKCFEKLKECPYDKIEIKKEVRIKNFSILSILDVPNNIIKERYKQPENKRTALQIYSQLVPCEHIEFKIWSKFFDNKAKKIWQGVISYLILKVVNNDIDTFPMKISLPPELDIGWHKLLLLPHLSSHVHSIIGTIIGHRPIKASISDIEYIKRLEFGYDKYEELFGLPCPYRTKIEKKVFQVHFKTPTGRTIMINLSDNLLVEEIKDLINGREGICQESQRLIYCGKQLEDAKTVLEYGIKQGDTIYIAIRLTGC